MLRLIKEKYLSFIEVMEVSYNDLYLYTGLFGITILALDSLTFILASVYMAFIGMSLKSCAFTLLFGLYFWCLMATAHKYWRIRYERKLAERLDKMK